MRLTCPSCGTEYEVEDTAIPPEGRDVQCSNCQTLWFQTAGPGIAAAAEERAPSAGEEAPGFAPPPPLPQREIDPAVLAILHEEAARETAARAVEKAVERARAESASPVPPSATALPEVKEAAEEAPKPAGKVAAKAPAKTPTKTPMKTPVKTAAKSAAPKAPVEAKSAATIEKMEPQPGLVDQGQAEAAPRPAKARPALPDVEAVKSSLAAREAAPLAALGAGALDYEGVPRRGRGFGRGFVTALLFGALLWGAYAEAPRLAKAWPPAAPYLAAYAQKVDHWRQSLAAALSHVAQKWQRSDVGL